MVVQAGDIAKVENSRCVVTGNVIDTPPADTAVYGYNAVVCTGNISRRSGDVGFSFDESRYVTCCNNVVEGANTAGITIFKYFLSLVFLCFSALLYLSMFAAPPSLRCSVVLRSAPPVVFPVHFLSGSAVTSTAVQRGRLRRQRQHGHGHRPSLQ